MNNFIKRALGVEEPREHGPKLKRLLAGLKRNAEAEQRRKEAREERPEEEKPRGLPFPNRRRIT